MADLVEVVDSNFEQVETDDTKPTQPKIEIKPPRFKFKHLLFSGVGGFVLGAVLVFVLVFRFYDMFNPETRADPTTPTSDILVVEPELDGTTLTIQTVQEVLKPTAALITSEYHYTDADIYEDNKKLFDFDLPFTNTKAVFTYKGTMSIGIDLQSVEYDISEETKEISITLPTIGILSHDIDLGSFQFPFEEESIFNPKEMSDYVGALDKLKNKQAELVLNDETYMSDALHNTQEVIRLFLENSEFTRDYTVIFVSNEVFE